MRALLDTNVVLRNANMLDPLYPRVNQALRKLAADGWDLCIAPQNVVEFLVVATRPVAVNGFGLTSDEARQEIDVVMNSYTVLPDPPDLLQRWLDLCTRYQARGRQAHDARLVAFMQGHGIAHLLTLNAADFVRYADVVCPPLTGP
ncbi:MAG: PIN domain nuclease [Armatimonadetes bacterium]|nr:PIN domain nuclease [Armatimonadota bacterium]